MMKKILIVDDSALMRRVLCDIINGDRRFQVADKAANGLIALDLLSSGEKNGLNNILLSRLIRGQDSLHVV